jgi:hypothetical protein
MTFEKDLFGFDIPTPPQIEVNIYADESMYRKCPHTNNKWHYMCLIVERIDRSLLDDLINERYCNNLDQSSSYLAKNDKILHWADIKSADEVNICKRWFQYILNPEKSSDKFYCYILGLNESFLSDDEFDKKQRFNSIYNRFFRTAIDYSLKSFWGNNEIVIKNIYHEQGQQKNNIYFPWHSIEKLQNKEPNFKFETNEIQFLAKDHKIDEKGNILQLCDCFLGAIINLIHGLENPESKKSQYKNELLKLLLPLCERMMNNPDNPNSYYHHKNRIMIRFFPKEKTEKNSIQRGINQYYAERKLKYEEDITPNKQLTLC